ncbi:hypothetical protein [Saccharibacillus endophyticus]|uniref:WW domain-containing protein n=1 Tax=Saccharibacillus endophyticus TaxID=2060666 RepID=A0ABQ1ZS59_9BACL|nr:hypothetical protein [Saccharibacillus endophyticus]GGH73195.1 hypothetical protein GCM10007362_12110 [Saccharibacillus endophyticus]
MRIKYEILQLKWLVILAIFLIWCWRQRASFVYQAAVYEEDRTYNVWDIVFDQVMNPFAMLWLLLPIWLVLSLRTIIELGETTVLIRVRNDRAWLGLVVKKLSVPLVILLMLWGLAIGSTTAGMSFEGGWSEFTTSEHWLNFFTHSFAAEGWAQPTAIAAQFLLLALFLQMLTVWLATAWIYTEKSWAVSLLAAGLMIGCLIAYHKQSHFPEWQWASIINWMLLLNARHTFGTFWPAFVGSPLLMLGCVGLIDLRRNRIIFAGLFRIKRRLLR